MSASSPAAGRPSNFRLLFWGELSLFALMVAEVWWIGDIYEPLVFPQVPFAASLAMVALALIGSHYLVRWMNTRYVRLGVRRAVMIGWISVLILGGLALVLYPNDHLSLGELLLHPIQTMTLSTQNMRDFWHVLVILLLVWRGVSLGREQANLPAAQFSFQLGLLAMLFYGLIFSWTRPLQAVWSLYGFLFASLISMSSARISELSHLRGGRVPVFNVTWSAGIVGAALSVVGLGVFGGWSFSTWAIGAASVILQGILLIVTLIGLLVLSPLILGLLWLAPQIQGFFDSLLNSQAFQALKNLIAMLNQVTSQFPDWLGILVRILVPIILLIGLGLIVAAIFYNMRTWRRRGSPVGEMGELGLMDSPVLRLPQVGRRGKRLGLFGRGDLLAAARIRWIYAQLMRLSSELGSPRPAAKTPLEFQPELESLFPEEKVLLAQLTQAYVRVRYGEFPENQSEVTEILNGWNRLKQLGRKEARKVKRARARGLNPGEERKER